jgi:hypothetical protein
MSIGHIWPSVIKDPDTKNIFLFFFSVECYCGHFKPILDKLTLKSAKSMINFDPTPRGRNEVQKNKPTPYGLTELDGESEKNNRFSPRELSFWANTVLTKNGS